MPHASVLSLQVLAFPIEMTGIPRQLLAAILSFCPAAPVFPDLPRFFTHGIMRPEAFERSLFF